MPKLFKPAFSIIFILTFLSSLLYAGSDCADFCTKPHVLSCKPIQCVKDIINISNLTTIVPPPPNSTNTSFLEPNEQFLPGTLYRNCEEEISLSINPTNPLNMVAYFHQDRWSSGACLGLGMRFTTDGGKTWQLPQTPIPSTVYEQPGTPYLRSSDPWVSFGPDGTCHAMILSIDLPGFLKNDLLISRSTDGGNTWSPPQLIAVGSPELLNDKEVITADPQNAQLVYAAWQAFTQTGVQLGYTRSTDNGMTYEPVQVLLERFDTDIFNSFLGTNIEVLVDGTLLMVWTNATASVTTGKGLPVVNVEAIRSFDKGATWENTPITIAQLIAAPGVDNDFSNSATDVELQIDVRDAGHIPAIASNASTGQVYVTYQDKRFNPNGLVGCVIITSKDNGATWSNPVPINPNSLNVQTFLPSVAVLPSGKVAVLYYDFRHAIGGAQQLATDVWINIFDEDLTFLLQEIRVTPESFDMRQFDIAGGYFCGDYTTLKADDNDLVAAFTISHPLDCFPPIIPPPVIRIDPKNRQNCVFARVNPAKCKKQCPVPLDQFRSITQMLMPVGRSTRSGDILQSEERKKDHEILKLKAKRLGTI